MSTLNGQCGVKGLQSSMASEVATGNSDKLMNKVNEHNP